MHMQFLIALLGYVLLWVLLMVGLGGIMAYYLQLQVLCDQRSVEMTEATVGTTGCLYFVDTGESCEREQTRARDGSFAGMKENKLF